MDPISISTILGAVAGGAGDAIGGQAWAGLTALVRRPFQHASDAGDNAGLVPSGSAELAALQSFPADRQRATALAEVLLARAGADSAFRDALQVWWEQASRISGDVTNTISGGTQHGPVVQGRDFSGLTFNAPSMPRTVPPGPDSDAR